MANDKVEEIQALIEKGKKRGYLTFKEVDEVLPKGAEPELNRRHLTSMFEDMDIEVVEASPEEFGEDFEEDEDEDEHLRSATSPAPGIWTIPIKIYFREMGEKALLDREGEIRLARAIEEGLENHRQGGAQLSDLHRLTSSS